MTSGRRWRRRLGILSCVVVSLVLHLWVLRAATTLERTARLPAPDDTVMISLLPAPQEAPPEPSTPDRPKLRKTPPASPKPPAAPVRSPAVDTSAPIDSPSAAPSVATAATADIPEASPSEGAVPGPIASEDGQRASTDAPGAVPAHAMAQADPAASDAAAAQPLAFGQALPAPPSAARLRYRVFYGDYTDARLIAGQSFSFEQDGVRYRMGTEGRAEGLTALFYSGALVQSSEGRVGPDGFVPERFSERRGDRPGRTLSIDAERRELLRGQAPAVKVPPGTQDRLSVLMQLGLLARAMPERFERGAVIEVNEVTFGGVDRVRWRSEGSATLPVDTRELRTIHLVRERARPATEPLIEIWLGYDHALMPVRIRLSDAGGRTLDQLIIAQDSGSR